MLTSKPLFYEIDNDNVYLVDSTFHTLGDFRRFIRTHQVSEGSACDFERGKKKA